MFWKGKSVFMGLWGSIALSNGSGWFSKWFEVGSREEVFL